LKRSASEIVRYESASSRREAATRSFEWHTCPIAQEVDRNLEEGPRTPKVRRSPDG